MQFRLCSLMLVLTSGLSFGQTNSGKITGTVTDQQNAVLQGVKVTATNVATNISERAISSNAGVYALPALEPGVYRITAEMAGFQKLNREGIGVETAGEVTLDLQLTVGDTKTEVTVLAEAPLVQQSNSTVQYEVNGKQIDELPLQNQSALQVLSLVPGVLGSAGGEQASITTGYVTPGGGISVSGGRMGATMYQADGVNNNSLFFGRISLSFSSDAVAEVSVKVNSYSAEYGRVGGGIVNMATKSGTNQIHGTVFSFSQNDILNAAPYQNSFSHKGTLRYWRGGVDVGGPVYIPKLFNGKNRVFFFFGYEPLRQYAQSSAFARVPTAAEKQGDFSHSIVDTTSNMPVYLFQQFEANPSGTGWTNTPIVEPAGTPFPQFANNVIPKSLISPIGQKILNLMPEPNIPLNGLGQNYSIFRNVHNTDNRWNVKTDVSISSNNRLSFRVSQVPAKGLRAFIPGIADVVPTDTSTGTNMALSDTQTWGGNKVNELRLGFNRTSNVRRQTDQQLSEDGYQQYGFPSYLSKGFPQISYGGGYSNVQGISSDPGNYEIDNTLQFTDILSWTRGHHNLKMGFETMAPQMDLIDYGSVGGSWSFATNQTNIGSGNPATVLGVPNAATGLAMASLLMGFPSGISAAPAVIPYQYRWKYYAGFLQDDLKLTPRLTLNLGIRYQVEVSRSDKHHNQGYFVDQMVTLANGKQQEGYLQMDGLGGAPNTLWPTRYNNLEPRVGFAYRLPHLIKGLTVMRGGYAITHEPTSGLFRIPIPDLSPPAAQFAANGAANGGQVQLDNFPLVLPKQNFTFPADGKITNLAGIASVYFLPKSVAIPYIQQWNLGFGWEFGRNLGFEMTYVGSKGTQLFGPSQLYNTVNIAAYAQEVQQGLNMNQLFPNPAGLTDQNGNIIMVTRQNLLRPIPTLGAISNPLAQGYGSFYHSLQLNLTKRYSMGLQFNVNFTWMKSTDDTSCDGQFCNDNIQNWGVGAAQLLNNESRSLEHSVSVFDIADTLRFSYNWDLPVGRGKHFLNSVPGWMNQVVGNWKWTGTGNIQSGMPLQAWTGNNTGYPEDVGHIRPNVNPGVNPYLPNWIANCNNPVTQRCPYVNSLALFSPPTALTVGNAPRVFDYIRMPHVITYNMAILKEFPIHEQVKLAFRAELYGALNHVYFQTNGNNFTVYQNLNYTNFTNPPVNAASIAPAYADIQANIGGTRTIQLGLKLYF
jgi:hypothetical protein